MAYCIDIVKHWMLVTLFCHNDTFEIALSVVWRRLIFPKNIEHSLCSCTLGVILRVITLVLKDGLRRLGVTPLRVPLPCNQIYV